MKQCMSYNPQHVITFMLVEVVAKCILSDDRFSLIKNLLVVETNLLIHIKVQL